MRHLGPIAAFLLACASAPAAAQDVAARPGALAAALAAAEPGAVLNLAPGIHEGPLVLDRPVTLACRPGAVIDGRGQGSVITVTASDVTLRGCGIENSGRAHETIDSGVRLLEGADRAVIEGNRLRGNLYGVDIHGARDARVARNVIEGGQEQHVNRRGNGVYVWNAPGAVVEGNDIRWGRDGIFVNTSRDNTFRNNRFRDLRFAVHYMYANDSEVSGNLSVGNDLGYAVMYSRNVRITGNASIGDREHGIMLNYANDSVIEGNLVRNGENRCLFIYNAHRNRIAMNRFERCDIGIHFTAGSERNAITGNAFVGNRTQVKYVGSKWVEWSDAGRGNHWSDFAAFDLDGDGIADAPYRPNDSMDHVLWTQPAAKLLLGAPAVQLVRWAQHAFPALLPGGVIDGAPMMQAVEPSLPDWEIRHDG
ncbi:nitrous oxide reductase family maturation protein NosD [Limibaculum sp. M0105]|uniref:Nitrous oxide reductase family maturation protein NosD n=1 Tax=Thermohalobaculum xanthum TaxID=2753746 RepID=A0A8J7M708_9RHOB|nr:nitrous oxide reductase family maturation protein NosD [Thermohalobaculum xanthum]MBK0399458.1 nitrous oxide reductase family maturation protein NosD [Thermohalobaculum xanthum]